jgi:hypothetical protein
MTFTLEPETTATATVMTNSSTSGTPILSATAAAGTAVAAMMQPEFDIPLIAGIAGGVGGLLILICIAVVVICAVRRRGRTSEPTQTAAAEPVSGRAPPHNYERVPSVLESSSHGEYAEVNSARANAKPVGTDYVTF